jgi:DNA repair exonuclease SbcCD ATPase subunit
MACAARRVQSASRTTTGGWDPHAISPAEELKQLQADLKQLLGEAERIKSRIADIIKTAGDVEQKNKDFEKAAAANDKAVAQLNARTSSRAARLLLQRELWRKSDGRSSGRGRLCFHDALVQSSCARARS